MGRKGRSGAISRLRRGFGGGEVRKGRLAGTQGIKKDGKLGKHVKKCQTAQVRGTSVFQVKTRQGSGKGEWEGKKEKLKGGDTRNIG